MRLINALYADHVPRGGGQDGHQGAGCCSLPPSPSPVRANPALSDRRRVLPGALCPFGGAGWRTARLCTTGVRGLPKIRLAGSRLFVGTLRVLLYRAPGCLQLQTPRFCPSCGARRMAEKRGLTGRRSAARATHAPVGIEFPIAAAIPVRQPGGDHGADCGEPRSSFQRCWFPVSRIRGA
jgi:hypothetical protein